MSRAILWWTGGVIAALLLAATGIWSGFDRIPQTVHTPPEPIARNNIYLAFERFGRQMGRPITVGHEAEALDQLQGQQVLILAEARERVLTPERVKAILRWVDEGGHLILPAESSGRDPLLSALKVRVAPRRAGTTPPPHAARDELIALRLGDSDRIVNASIPTFWNPLESYGSPAPDWSAGNSTGEHFMHFTRGQGAITVVWPWSAIASNVTLGTADNAEVVWTLLNLVHRSGPILMLTQVRVVTLGQWLRDSAWAALASGALVLLVWIGRIVPRFGPLLAEPMPERRALVEHLRAMGRAVWRAKEEAGLRYWLACVRQSVYARAAVRDPILARLPPIEQARAIAVRVSAPGQLDASRVRSALAGTAVSLEDSIGREGFTQAIVILQQVEAQL
jgi:hypothetical protein